MEVYSITRRRGEIRRLAVNEIVTAVFLMAARAKKLGYDVIFFPEAGGLPLKYIFQHGPAKEPDHQERIFSAKVTASTKSSLSKQICALLSPAECKAYLTKSQVGNFKKAMSKLPRGLKKELSKAVDLRRLECNQLHELIAQMIEIGLRVPSEARANWIRAGIIAGSSDPNSYLPENDSVRGFRVFRKRIIAYSLDHISDIVHGIRPLLNIVLSETNFAKATRLGKIYVIDEAISRGRTLNAMEIIFKAFNADVSWKIGVLYCPLNDAGHGKLDYVFSSTRIPTFSNRFDLIGNIVVESDKTFARYDIEGLLRKAEHSVFRHNRSQFLKYFKHSQSYVRHTFASYFQPGVCDIKDVLRLLHFVFVCPNQDIIKRCINLNPVKIPGIIEEASFYINMPHPLDPMPIRKRYKETMLELLRCFEKAKAGPEYASLEREFHAVRKHYEFLELRCWARRYRTMRLQIDKLLNQRTYDYK